MTLLNRFWCKTCGNVTCTCKTDAEHTTPEANPLVPQGRDRTPEIEEEGPRRTFLITNEETGVAEVLSHAEVEQRRKFNELFAATPVACVTFALIAINIVIFMGMVIGGVYPFQPTPDSLLAWGADYGPLTTQGQWWRLFTAMFAHAGVLVQV
jgi:membrane associated rhomboid family serine protease